ncbi:hypothetical protein Y1Q_0021651 [Alligator mississippiensis]|uniref:Uncharacterized protein n=1 Tax=Alligator mississippiensis TaxID=8496 RepID=A0A151PAT4_ALLMI|nr:hypothetical protein Y1Q_0021651 [Alligator mississippiensis]
MPATGSWTQAPVQFLFSYLNQGKPELLILPSVHLRARSRWRCSSVAISQIGWAACELLDWALPKAPTFQVITST